MEVNNDCIWSPRILREIVKSVSLIRRQTTAHFNVMKMDAAKKRNIVYGIDTIPKDLNDYVDGLMNIPAVPKPKFYVASEMAQVREDHSRAEMLINKEMKLHLGTRYPMCLLSESRAILMFEEMRKVLNKFHMSELELQMELKKKTDDAEDAIQGIFADFITEIKTEGRHMLVTDDVLGPAPTSKRSSTSLYSPAPIQNKQSRLAHQSVPAKQQSVKLVPQSSPAKQQTVNLVPRSAPAKQQSVESVSSDEPSITVEKLKEMLLFFNEE